MIQLASSNSSDQGIQHRHHVGPVAHLHCIPMLSQAQDAIAVS